MSGTALLIAATMAVVVVGALLPATASADTYVVGDGDGWDLGVDYNEWASGLPLKVGDKLKFKYSTAQPFPHDVVEVDEESFKACTVPSDAGTLTTGNDEVTLYYPGQYFFISSLQSDCQYGMKLAINVAQRGSDDGDDNGDDNGDDDGDDNGDDDGDDGTR